MTENRPTKLRTYYLVKFIASSGRKYDGNSFVKLATAFSFVIRPKRPDNEIDSYQTRLDMSKATSFVIQPAKSCHIMGPAFGSFIQSAK